MDGPLSLLDEAQMPDGESALPERATADAPNEAPADEGSLCAEDGPAPVSDVSDAAAQPAVPEAEPPESTAAITPMQVVEAILFAADGPMPGAKIAQVLGAGDARDVRRHVAALNEKYEQIAATFRVQEIAGGYQMMTLPVFHNWLAKVNKARQETRLSPAAMETLAVVAYKQPVTRAEIESIRGVAAGEVLNRLREMDLVRIVGRADDLGRPMLYGTTRRFLEVFGLSGLDALPKVEDVFAPSGQPRNADPQPAGDASCDAGAASGEHIVLPRLAPEGAGIDRPDDMPLPPIPEEPPPADDGGAAI